MRQARSQDFSEEGGEESKQWVIGEKELERRPGPPTPPKYRPGMRVEGTNCGVFLPLNFLSSQLWFIFSVKPILTCLMYHIVCRHMGAIIKTPILFVICTCAIDEAVQSARPIFGRLN